MADVADRERVAHRSSVTMEIDDLAGYLQDALGQKLVAHIAGVSDHKTVGNWVRGDHAPRPENEEKLRFAYRILHMLQAEDSLHTARAWFVGLNPQLGDESPATAIREGDLQDVLIAAKAFLTGG
jgi:hypothetical protein